MPCYDRTNLDSRLSFAIERGDRIVAVTPALMSYRGDSVVGTVNEPTVISFTTTDHYADGVWYDLHGRQLTHRPAQKGVYIYNGQKTMIK